MTWIIIINEQVAWYISFYGHHHCHANLTRTVGQSLNLNSLRFQCKHHYCCHHVFEVHDHLENLHPVRAQVQNWPGYQCEPCVCIFLYLVMFPLLSPQCGSGTALRVAWHYNLRTQWTAQCHDHALIDSDRHTIN